MDGLAAGDAAQDVERRQRQPDVVKRLARAGDDIGDAEHEEIAALGVRHLAREHGGDLAHGQPPQQTFGDGDRKALR